MNKIFVLLMPLWCFYASAQNSLYDIQLDSYKGERVGLSSYKDQKIIVATFSLASLQSGKIKFLDSLQSRYPNLKVIIIPVADSTQSADSIKLSNMKQDIKSGMVVTRSDKVRKGDGSNQNALMKWLTDAKKNGHFNSEVRTQELIYVINSYGVLYAKLEKGVSAKTLTAILAEPDSRRYPDINQ